MMPKCNIKYLLDVYEQVDYDYLCVDYKVQ